MMSTSSCGGLSSTASYISFSLLSRVRQISRTEEMIVVSVAAFNQISGLD